MERFLSRFFNIPVYHPKKTIVFLIAVTVLLGLGLPGLEFENSLSGMMPRHDIEYITNENVKAVYGNNGKFIIIDVSSGSMMSRDTFIRTDNLITDIEEYRNYNDELERSRIKRVSAIDAGQGINSAELPVMFKKDDPVFSRTLSRKIKKLSYENTIIYKKELNKIISDLENTRAVKEKKYVDEILSPFTMKGLSGKDDTLTTYDLMSMDAEGRRILPETEKEFAEFEAVLRHNPAYLKGIYSEDPAAGKISDFGIFLRLIDIPDHDAVAREIFEIAGSYNSSDLRVLTQGEPVLYKQIYDYMQSDLMFFVPLVLLVISVIFFLNFGTLQGVLVPLATLIVADIWLLGLMGHLGFRLSVLGISLPPLMISVGSSYSIHIINRFLIDKESIALDRKAGLHGSMKTIGMTLFLASITTVIGFATNMATQVSSIFEWGVFAAIGTFFAVFIAALFVPAVFSFVEIRTPANIINTILKGRSKNNFPDKACMADRIVVFLAGTAVKHHRAVLAAAMIVAVISAAGVFRIRTETSLPSYFKGDDYINTSSVEIGEKFGGTMGLNILINTKNADGVKSSEFLNRVEMAREWLVSEENSDLHIGRTDAFGDFIKTMNMAMNNDDEKFYSIPARDSDIMDFFEIYSGDDENSDGRIDDFEPYIDPAFSTVNLFARLQDREGKLLGTSEISYIIERVRNHMVKEFEPLGCEITISGEPLIIQSLAKYIVYGQLWSLFLSLAAVCLVVIVLFRNIKAGFIALVPIGLALLFNFGVMGWMGIKLDIATAIIASITVGIGVDNTIHFLNNYRMVSRDKTLSFNEALITTLSVAGKAIIYAALALICGFSVLVVSSFKPIMLFGILMGITFIATTAGALLVLPAFIKAVNFSMDESTADADSRRRKTGGAGGMWDKLIRGIRRIGEIYNPVKIRYDRIMTEKVIPLLKSGE
jgi:predicted RND superfamily exporter protein